MSTTIDDGGKAFPSLDVYEGYDRELGDYVVTSDVETGMSLRDYFAAKAMNGIICGAVTKGAPATEWPDAAQFAYRVADAMISARKLVPALLLALLLPGLAQAGPLRLPSTAFLTAQALDLTTTARALQTVPGAYEVNPLGQSTSQRIALKSLTSAGVLTVAQVLAKRGHPRAASVMLWSATAAVGVVAVRNTQIGVVASSGVIHYSWLPSKST